MAPEAVVLWILGCVVLILGAFIWIFFLGRGYLMPRVDALEGQVKSLEAELKNAERAASARAHGASSDLDRAVDSASAADFSGVLDATYGSEPDPASREHGEPDA